MTLDLVTYELRFPKELTTEGVRRVLLGLAGHGSRAPLPVRLVARGEPERVRHFIGVPRGQQHLVSWLEQQLPGLRAKQVDLPMNTQPFVWKVWQSTSRRPLRTDREAFTTRALLVSLLGARGHETIDLSWLLGPVRRPMSVGNETAMLSESWTGALLSAAFVPPGDLDADARKALREKVSEPSWRLLGYISVAAADRNRARQLAADLMAALRTAEGPGVRLGVRRASARQMQRMPWRWPMQVNAAELASGLLAWPTAEAAGDLPVSRQRHRELRAAAVSPGRTDRVLGDGPDGQPIAQSRASTRVATHVLGPSGSGKSTLLAELILQDIQAGLSVVVLDAKGDLVDDVLRRYPLRRLSDLVVMDPSDSAPVGLNPLHRPREPELVADQLLGILAKLYADTFGPRTTDVMHASLLTLARWGQGSLAVLPLLLTNPELRRKIVGSTPDPLGTAPFWAWFERISDAERHQVIAPSLNKIRPFLLRPDLRAVIGQTAPRFQLREVLTKRRVVLCSLSEGRLGPEGAALLGTLLLNQLWQLIQSRASLPSEQRHQIAVHLDEFQTFVRLPGDLADLLVRARGLGASFTLAHQHLAQLDADVRAAVLSSARSRIVFQLAADDARVMAAGHPEVDAADLTSLPPFEAYASLLVGNQVQPYVSVRTRPPMAPSTPIGPLLAASRERYGVPREVTEEALNALAESPAHTDGPIGRRPRRSP